MTKHSKSDTSRDGDTQDKNRDPISGASGSHPVGTGAGAASGAAAGAAIGTAMGGPIGLAVGGVTGAVVGGLAGKGIAEAVNPTVEDAYWRENYSSRPYVNEGEPYETVQPAYQYGWESRSKNSGKQWDEVEPDMGREWDSARGSSEMAWEDAKMAARDAWDRIDDDDRRDAAARMSDQSRDDSHYDANGPIGEKRRRQPRGGM